MKHQTVDATDRGVELAFTSLTTEVSIDRLEVQGWVPEWLRGVLYRNGPARFETPIVKNNYWFDGLAMIHRYELDGAKISYRNRFLRTTPYREMIEDGEPASGFEFVRRTTVLQRAWNAARERFGSRSDRTYNTNVNIMRLAGRMMALTEQPVPTLFDASTLRTEGPFHYDDKLVGQLSSSHPQYDNATGCYYNFLVRLGLGHSYEVYQIHKKTTRRSLIASVPVRRPSYMHSFAMTRNYLILTEFPMFLKPAAGLLWGRAPKDSMEWMPVEGTRFLVLNKRSGKLEALHHSSAMFAFHHINAYERDDEIVLDIAATDEPTLLRKSQLTSLRQATLRADHPLSQFRRYRLPLRCGTRTLEPEIICDQLVEMVTINTDAVSGRRHRYCYGVGHNTAWQGLAGQLVKVDVKRGSIRTWFEFHTYPNEATFVGRPDATEEDDGVLLSVVLDTEKACSCLLVLDARTFSELGRAHLPHHVPLEFHGVFLRG